MSFPPGAYGSLPPPRADQRNAPDQSGLPPPGTPNFFPTGIVVVAGPGPGGVQKGVYVYSGTPGTGTLIESIVAANGTDGRGNTVYQGTATYAPSAGHSFVVDLLSTNPGALGFFQYNNPSGGAQGTLILSVAAASGLDPVTGAAFPAGLFGLDPAFGDSLTAVGANIFLGQVPYTRPADVVARASGGPTLSPFLLVDGPEQTTANHIQMQLQGFSPDGVTAPPQLLVGVVSGATILASAGRGMMQLQPSSGQVALEAITPTATIDAFTAKVTGDANLRWQVQTGGKMQWGSGAAAPDIAIDRRAANRLELTTADFDISTVGRGIQIAEGANARMGRATLAAGTVTVANTTVTAATEIFLTIATLAGVATPQAMDTSRVAGTSFTITSASPADTSVVSWLMVEPG